MKDENNISEFDKKAKKSWKRKPDNKYKFFEVEDYLVKWALTYIVVAVRNCGKTTAMLKYCQETIKKQVEWYDPVSGETLTKNAEFLWMRSSAVEVAELKSELKQRISFYGWRLYGNLIKDKEGTIIGRIAALSNSYNLASNEFSFVKTWVFDEGIPRRKVVIDHQAVWRSITDFAITLARNKKDLKFFIMANRIKDNNSLFANLGIYPTKDEWKWEFKKSKMIVYNLNEKHFKLPNQTSGLAYGLARFDKQTEAYAFHNENTDEDADKIMDPKRYPLTHHMDIQIGRQQFSVNKFKKGVLLIPVEASKNALALSMADSVFFANAAVELDTSIAEFLYQLKMTNQLFFSNYNAIPIIENYIADTMATSDAIK